MPEKQNLVKCIDEGWVSKGRFVQEFEHLMAERFNRVYGCSTSSGTSALHLALEACGVGPGDKVLVPTLTYIATVNAIIQCGAKPVFCDSRPTDWQIEEGEVADKIERGGIKAVVAVHLYGGPCDISFIEKICHQHKVFLIEDVAEAMGGSVDGRPLGSFGDASCFSFYGNKTVTTGEGGMVLCDDLNLSHRINHLKNHSTVSGTSYIHDRMGYNYRMSNLHAAVGCAQMDRLEYTIKRKEEICNLYTKTIFCYFAGTMRSGPIGGLGTRRLRRRGVEVGHWLYSLVADSKKIREGITDHLEERGIETRPFFKPCHTMEYMESEANMFDFPVARDLSGRGFNIPTYTSLTDDDVRFISEQIVEFFKMNVR